MSFYLKILISICLCLTSTLAHSNLSLLSLLKTPSNFVDSIFENSSQIKKQMMVYQQFDDSPFFHDPIASLNPYQSQQVLPYVRLHKLMSHRNLDEQAFVLKTYKNNGQIPDNSQIIVGISTPNSHIHSSELDNARLPHVSNGTHFDIELQFTLAIPIDTDFPTAFWEDFKQAAHENVALSYNYSIGNGQEDIISHIVFNGDDHHQIISVSLGKIIPSDTTNIADYVKKLLEGIALHVQ